MRVALILITTIFATCLAQAETPAHLYYTGTINNKLAIQMELSFAGTLVSGHYAFDSIGERIDLTGSWNTAGGVRLGESVHQREIDSHAGTFIGNISADRRRFAGHWENAGRTQTFLFSVTAVAEYHTLKVEHGYLHLAGIYPVFLVSTPAWKSLTAQLYAKVVEGQRTFGSVMGDVNPGTPLGLIQETSLHIAFYRRNFVSLLGEEFTETGGEHANTDFSSLNYQMTAKGPLLLGLQSLFNPKTPFMDAISDIVQADLERNRVAQADLLLAAPRRYSLTPKMINTYTCSATGITFVFPRYLFDNYASGDFFATIPYPLLKDYLHPSGPLATLAKNRRINSPAIRDAVTGLSAEAAMHLGREAFETRYAATQAKETYAPGDGYGVYATCMHARNAWQATTLPLSRRNQYLKIRHILENLAATRFAIDHALFWILPLEDTKNENAAFCEDMLTKVITALQAPMPNAAARRQAQMSLAAAGRQVRSLVTPRHTPDDSAVYTMKVRVLLRLLSEVTHAAPAWPDNVAAVVGVYAEQITASNRLPSRTK